MHCPLTRQQLHDVDGLLKRLGPESSIFPLDPFLPAKLVKSSSNSKTSPQLRPANPTGVNESVVRCKWGWNLSDAALYYTWIAFAPPHCPSCGALSGGVMPSIEDQYSCACCMAGIGHSTAARDVVEEIGVENEEGSDDDDEELGGGGGAGSSQDHAVLHTIRYLLVVLRTFESQVPVSAYPQVLRIAAGIVQLICLPDTEPDWLSLLRCAALYVACAVLVPAKMSFPALQRAASCGLQWLDVVAAAKSIGADIEDFFDDAVGHTKNFMAELPQPRLPSKLWNAEKSALVKTTLEQLQKVNRTERHSPDHTAAIVVLELCRSNPEAAEILPGWVDGYIAADESAASLRNDPVLVRFSSDAESQNKSLNFLLSLFAKHFGLHPVQLCIMMNASRLYGDATEAAAILQSGLSCGLYPVPLVVRNTPAESPWESVYRCLHSSDRIIVSALLEVLSKSTDAPQAHPEALKTLQAILAKHGSCMTYTANYCLRVADPTEQSFNGDYFCSSVTPDGAAYIHFTKPMSIRYRAKSHTVYLNDAQTPASARRQTPQLNAMVLPPTRLDIAGPAVKLLIDCCSGRIGWERWTEAARRIEIRWSIQRRMRANPSQFMRVAVLSNQQPHVDSRVAQILSHAPSLMDSFKQANVTTLCPLLAVQSAATDPQVLVRAAALQHIVELLPNAKLGAPSKAQSSKSTAAGAPHVSPALPPQKGSGEAPAKADAEAQIALRAFSLDDGKVLRHAVKVASEVIRKRKLSSRASDAEVGEAEVSLWAAIDGESALLVQRSPAQPPPIRL